MNINSSCSNENQCKVILSKYFSRNCGMDESLSDFQEKKKSFEPRNVQKTIKFKKKKATKLIKGQTKIKTLLNKKKNELVSYSKDFDNICKQSGVDVDPEQLQLAVALSKSLQPVETITSTSTQLNSQGRTAKIRSTLREYGFTVPDIKISNSSKRLKKLRKNYKLILCTDVEKQQIIADKYSQVLFENIDTFKNSFNYSCNNYSDIHLYYLTTHVPYNEIRNNDVFYIPDLSIETSVCIGTSLRDWSEIPGRPVSPKFCENKKINMSNIMCSQDELDIILSGSLKCAQNIVNSKTERDTIIVDDISNNSTCTRKVIEIFDDNANVENISKRKDASSVSDIENDRMLKVSAPVRSYSPDLFDDETSSFISNAHELTIQKSQETACNIIKTNEDIIEIIECCNDIPGTTKDLNTTILPITNRKSGSQLSQKSDISTRKSDPMELTECIAIQHNFNYHENTLNLQLSSGIDITKRKSNDFMDLTECITHISQGNPIRVCNKIDLTQISSENNNKVVTEKIENDDNASNDIDLTQSSDSSDNLPFVHVSDKSFDDTIILNNSEIIPSISNKRRTSTNDSKEDRLNLSNDIQFENRNNLPNESFFNDYMYNHSNDDVQSSCIDLNVDDKIDLSQDTDSEECNDNSVQSASGNKINIENINEMSIDYDDVCFENNMSVNQKNFSTKGRSLSKSDICESDKSPEKHELPSSQDSEVFEISDRELDYSLHKSRYDELIHVDFQSSNMNDNESNRLKIFNKSSNNETRSNILNRSFSDSFLPIVNIKKSVENADRLKMQSCHSAVSTPEKVNKVTTETPNDYIVKIHQVTPILDYASMTTPERNKELDKYGLKPFKRKRAIRLLTHIYNQTHPVIAPCANEELLSPSKKRKTEIKATNSVSPKKSPLKSTKNNFEGVKENIYQITKELPDLREIECSSDDWVFQKKEKAKVHSCRVPLHIAFHNFLSCRRGLREAILRYEPVNIDIIHKELVACGHRYDPKDLLKFLDKKCITVKTSDNNSRNNRK
ncbi:structure-specific endonuclease subunit SLX4 [Galleria mellonella]|uniref:Structure-specific endonuclease subunit SLX4 n=1 Tax=Galleria mellonella TaxID=7137 RepID=A0ABM3MIP2_GALME|nr:structure-specific endonuclease subunit SLX4 [Galleria mellonella]